jgi:hypothetical protein
MSTHYTSQANGANSFAERIGILFGDLDPAFAKNI